jgi:hypothetical protein
VFNICSFWHFLFLNKKVKSKGFQNFGESRRKAGTCQINDEIAFLFFTPTKLKSAYNP